MIVKSKLLTTAALCALSLLLAAPGRAADPPNTWDLKYIYVLSNTSGADPAVDLLQTGHEGVPLEAVFTQVDSKTVTLDLYNWYDPVKVKAANDAAGTDYHFNATNWLFNLDPTAGTTGSVTGGDVAAADMSVIVGGSNSGDGGGKFDVEVRYDSDIWQLGPGKTSQITFTNSTALDLNWFKALSTGGSYSVESAVHLQSLPVGGKSLWLTPTWDEDFPKVPEPAFFQMAGFLSLGGLGLLRLRRRRK